LKRRIATMAPDDSRQFMMNNNFEVYEKTGVPSGAMEVHFHNFYEIIYILEGDYAVFLDDTTYGLKKGDIFLIESGHHHRYQYVENEHDNNRRIVLWISKAFLGKLSGGAVDLPACFSMPAGPAFRFPIHYRGQFESYLKELLFLHADTTYVQPENHLLAHSYLTLFFVYLNRLCLRKKFYFNQDNVYHNPLIHSISKFISEHLQEAISLDILAEQVHLSKYHLERVFKAATGVTIHNFVTQKRLIMACELIWSGTPLNELCFLCGFQNYSSFFRNFKSVYGISPLEYKNYFENNQLLD